jgi:uncharacterized damage-inducible protein DinB
MPINETILPEFDQEMANTRKVLERVPDGRLDFKPHPKSWSVQQLATHVAQLPSWAVITMTQDSIDIAPPGQPPYQAPMAGSQKEMIETFDKHAKEARAAIAAATDQTFFQPWSLLKGGQTMMTMPKAAVLRAFVMNHIIHHRAQLGVYLRLLDVPVPGMYGPSADEPAF